MQVSYNGDKYGTKTSVWSELGYLYIFHFIKSEFYMTETTSRRGKRSMGRATKEKQNISKGIWEYWNIRLIIS